MSYRRRLAEGGKILSFEFFPPKSEEHLSLTQSRILELARFNPQFMTVTYGAGGGTRHLTRVLAEFIAQNTTSLAVSHLTCVGHTADDIDQILAELYESGVHNVLALRGDPPKGQDKFEQHPDGFACARDLVRHISQRHPQFGVAVAGYPEKHLEALSVQADIDYLKEKVDAGADLIFTQLFFDEKCYFDFLDKTAAAGINVPIIPGIMPIGNVAQVQRFTSMCGASIPAELVVELEKRQDDSEAVINFGIEYAIKLCQKLLDGGAPGIHLYTLNKSRQVVPVVEELFGPAN